MIKTQLFIEKDWDKHSFPLDSQINKFLESDEVKLIEIKFDVEMVYETNSDEIRIQREALLVYEHISKVN